jgi:hypothetical protein
MDSHGVVRDFLTEAQRHGDRVLRANVPCDEREREREDREEEMKQEEEK